ncbi:MAG: peptidoglycan-binding protein [Clostridia bacterium]|nr:peptidoglycan-binding protein [Clostridia bacterium]
MMRRMLALVLVLALTTALVGALALSPGTLRQGSRGPEVTRLQEALQQLGYYRMAVDGVYGKGTIAAVKAFQARSGLKADGLAGARTQEALYATAPETPDPGPSADPAPVDPASPAEPAESAHVYPPLGMGARGSGVSALQTALMRLGLYSMKVDGAYGKGTAAAVRAFQQRAGLPVTGTADSATQAALYSGETASPDASAQVPAQAGPAPASLRQGLSHPAVAEMKAKLRYLGYYAGGLTDDFDGETRTAVVAFQARHGLTRDGIAGRKTLAALDSAWASARAAAGDLPEEAAVWLNTLAVQSGAVCGTLVLAKDGVPFLTWSFGGAGDTTCFRIASVTKWVTAIGLMTLCDQGKLDLDRDISDYLPFTVRNPAWPDTPITARMLLSHTSSLSPDAQNYHPVWTRIGQGGYDPLFNEAAQPGTLYAYADYNGALLGCLMEAITGESVQRYMDRTVFQPLGLTASYEPGLLPAGTPVKDLLTPTGGVAISVRKEATRAYTLTPDPVGNNGYTVGRLYISTRSLTRLAAMMLAGGELDGVRILREDTVALMEADQPGLARSKYGLGTVRHDQFPRGTWYGHQGRYSGLTSNVYYQRETGISLALVMDGYDYQLEDNIAVPAALLMHNMAWLEELLSGEGVPAVQVP